MLASSQADPLLGIDVHWELVPMPAPVPTPIPNPFTGIIFDPIGLAAGLVISNAIGMAMGAQFKGPVMYWTAFPATNTGTEGKHIPGHILIPPGTGWAPVPRTPRPKIRPGDTIKPPKPISPDNDAVCVVGSKTVHVMGSNAVRLGDLVMSCSEPVRLPSSVVLAIPKGAPILIGGPPTLDLMAAALASLRTRFMGDTLQAAISRLPIGRRGRAALSWIACKLTGHPVDVATGKMMTRALDAELPGPLPLRIERFYMSSFASRRGPLGNGWSLSLHQAVWEERGKVVHLTDDGREIEFDTFHLPERQLRVGDTLFHPIDRVTLERTAPRQWRITSQDGVRREFSVVPGRTDGRALIQRIVSPGGDHEIAFAYDERGRLEWVRDSAGRLIGVECDEHDRVVTLKLPLPHADGWYVHRRYEYDAEGDLVRVIDPRRNAWHFEYVTHLMVRETDRTGLSFYFEYDGLGEDAWCTRTWGDGGIYDHVIRYDKKGRITYVTNSLGKTTQYHMSPQGLVMKEIDARGGETTYQYDPLTFQRTQRTDPTGHTVTSQYDARGNVVLTRGPDGAETRFEYDGADLPTRARDPNGGEWRWSFDARRRITGRQNPDGHWTRFEYEDDRLSRILWPAGGATEYDLDRSGQPRLVQVPNGGRIAVEYDRLGRPIRIVNPLGGVEHRRYDVVGNLIRREDADGSVMTFEYDEEQNPVRISDGRRDVRLRYTGFHQVHERSIAHTTLRYDYDTEGRLVAVENEAGERFTFERDACGFVVRQRAFDGSEKRFIRDAAGRATRVIRSSGSESALSYDPNGRLVEAKHSDGTFERYRYRTDGALVEATNADAEVHFERDVLGNVLCERMKLPDGGEHWVRSHYSPEGRRLRVESEDGHLHHIRRNAAGDVMGVEVESAGWRVDFERNAVGGEAARHFSSGISSQWEHDGAGRPTRRTVWRSGQSSEHELLLAWEGADRISAVVDSAFGRSEYRHDERGRLISASLPWLGEQHRVMDEVGNVFASADRSDRRYAAGGRLGDVAGVEYRYDEDGKLVEKREGAGRTTRLTWSASGLLRQLELPDGQSVRFAYDAMARRIRKQVFQGDAAEPLSEICWSWDGENPLTERDRDRGKSTWLFEPETFAPLAKLAEGRVWSVLVDQLGAPTEMADEGGEIVWQRRTDLYGNTYGQTDDVHCPFLWPGQYRDPEGFVYNRYRYYDPDSGSYLTPDPIGLLGGPRLYGYVPSPPSMFDPHGLMPWRWSDTGWGHHLVPRGKANSVPGLGHLGTTTNTPTFFPRPYVDGMHEAIHAAQRPHLGPLQGPWTGTADELLAASRAGLDDVAHIRGDLRIPSTGEVLASNVTPAEAFDRLKQWSDEQRAAGGTCGS